MKFRKVYISSMLQDFCTAHDIGDGMLAPSIFTVLLDPVLGDIISAAEAMVETSSDLYTFWCALLEWLNSGTDTTQPVSVDTLVTFISQMQDQMGLLDDVAPETVRGGTGRVGGGQHDEDSQAVASTVGGPPDGSQEVAQTADGSQSAAPTADGSQPAGETETQQQETVPATKDQTLSLASFQTKWAGRFKGDHKEKVRPSGNLHAIMLEIEKAMLIYAEAHDMTSHVALSVVQDGKALSVTQKVQKKSKPCSMLLRGKCTLVPTPRSYLVCSAGSVDIYIDGQADDTTTHPCLAWLTPSAANESDYNMEIADVEHEVSFQRGPIKQTFTLKMKSLQAVLPEDDGSKHITFVRPSLESEMAKEKKRKVSSVESIISDIIGGPKPDEKPETPVPKKQRRKKATSSTDAEPLAVFGEFAFLAMPLQGSLVDGNEPKIPYE